MQNINNLSAALSFQQLYPELKLFPAYWDRGHKPLVSWSKFSSGDPAQLQAWYQHYTAQGLQVYFCVATKQSGLTCLDLDNKGGKTGSASLQDLERIYGSLPHTMVVATPTGGWHCWFQGESKVSIGKIGNGIDTPVMAPVPGSFVQGKGEYRLVNTMGLNHLPPWVRTLAGIMRDRDPEHDMPMCEWDQDHNIKDAVQLLQSALPVTQGDNADIKTFRLAARLHDKAISMGTAIDLMLTHWYPRCTPNDKPQFIERKVENAYRYASDRAGNGTPDAVWKPPSKSEAFTGAGNLIQGLPTVDWVIKKYMEQRTINVWFGPSNTYKSFLAIDAALAVATGQPFAGQPTEPGLVFYLAAEGRGGMSRRLMATCRKRGITAEQANRLLVSNYNIPLDSEAGVQHLLEKIRDFELMAGKPALIIIDTLAASFGGKDENSTQDMNAFVNHLIRIREELETSILLVHHTGTQARDRARGSSVLEAGVDAVYRISRVKDEPYMCLHTPKKMKDGAPMPDTYFHVEGMNLGVNCDGEEITSLTMDHDPDYNAPVFAERWGKNQTIVHNCLSTHLKDGAQWVDEGEVWEWFREAYTHVYPGKTARRDNFKNMIRKMEMDGKITREAEQISLGVVTAPGDKNPTETAAHYNKVYSNTTETDKSSLSPLAGFDLSCLDKNVPVTLNNTVKALNPLTAKVPKFPKLPKLANLGTSLETVNEKNAFLNWSLNPK